MGFCLIGVSQYLILDYTRHLSSYYWDICFDIWAWRNVLLKKQLVLLVKITDSMSSSKQLSLRSALPVLIQWAEGAQKISSTMNYWPFISFGVKYKMHKGGLI